MKVVYIAGKYRGANAWEVRQNVVHAERWAYRVAQLGHMPLCPHTNTAHFDGTMTVQFWLDGTMELLRRSDHVLLIPGWEDSEGARDNEYPEAQRLGKPITIAPPWPDLLLELSARAFAFAPRDCPGGS